MEDGRLETGETGNTRETGEWLQERLVTGETGDRRDWMHGETGGGRQETGDGRQEMEENRQETVL